jgi:two-component system, chemotaxis family, sensor kinase Cph1
MSTSAPSTPESPAELADYRTEIDLTNCDREPIHIPGQIQAHGAILVAERASRRIVQVSGNLHELCGVQLEDALSGTLDLILSASALAEVQRIERDATGTRFVAAAALSNGRTFDMEVHVHAELLVIELEMESGDVPLAAFFDVASQAVASLSGEGTSRAYCARLAEVVRRVAGYHRVMVYRFAEDWSGHVWAESMADDQGLAPFLDLHYPASDIPAQARALFLQNRVRMLVDATYTHVPLVPLLNPVTGGPLDLSQVGLRGASVMYTEYLSNMGVRASLTLALTDHDRLWGLIACHHYGAARHVPHGVRVVCELLARVASLQISEKMQVDEARYRQRVDEVHAELIEASLASDDFGAQLAAQMSTVRALFDADGVAISHRGQVVCDGTVPAEQPLRLLLEFLAARVCGQVLATDHLASIYPRAASTEEFPAGVLALPLPGPHGDLVAWFRPEQVTTVRWAGDPSKPVALGPLGDRLTPRKSFALWLQTVRNTSLPWTPVERSAAERLRRSFQDVLVRRNAELARLNDALVRSNEELEAFAYAASHDLKEPLRGIYNHTDFLLQEAGGRLLDADKRRLDAIKRLIARTRGLIDALLEYSRVTRDGAPPTPVPLAEAAAAAVDILLEEVQRHDAQVLIGAMPTVAAARPAVEQVFRNLISNALKYTDRARPRVEVGAIYAGEPTFPAAARGEPFAVFVRDDGIGIADRHVTSVFQMFRRLHTQDRYGGGSGSGLAIVKKQIEWLGGKVWIESRLGLGTTVWFTLGGSHGGGKS